MIEHLRIQRLRKPDWMEAGSIPSNSVNVTLHGDAGQGVPVPLALLVADSVMIRDMCEGPEMEKHITLVGVEVSTLKSYVTLLSSGGEIKIMNINRDTVLRKLKSLLSMVGSSIPVDMETPAMEYGGHQTCVNQDTGTGVNNNGEIEDDVNQSSQIQMFTIPRNEVPPDPQNTISPATMSQSKLLSPRTVSKIIVSRPAGSRVSPSLNSNKSRGDNDVTPTVGVSSTSLVSQTKNCSVRPKVMAVIGSGSDIREFDEDMETARDTRSTDPIDAAVKKEYEYDQYEALLAPAHIKPGYDAINEVEILGSVRSNNSPKTSNAPTSLSSSNEKQAYPCRKCKRVFGNKGAWTRHILAYHTQAKEAKKYIDRPFICKHCNANFAKKKGLYQHHSRSCPVLKKKVGNPLRKSNRQSDSEDEKDLARQESNKGVEDVEVNSEEGEHQVRDSEEQEDTRDYHVSCKDCGGLFTKEKFERHQQQTGHTGDIIKLPPNLYSSVSS